MPEIFRTREKPVDEKSYVHVGNSMYPAMRALDEVYVTPDWSEIITGDIIVFQHDPTDKMIAHRVISVCTDGIRTMGDNNPKPDDLTLRPEMIIGKVTSIRRGKRMISVRGGRQGKLWMTVYRTIKKAMAIAEMILVMPYHLLARSGIFRIWLPANLKYKVIRIEKNENVSLLLSMGGRTIGRYNDRIGTWLIKPPYKLFVDETSLPVIPAQEAQIKENKNGNQSA